MNRRQANREVLDRLVGAHPVLVDCVPAGRALGLGTREVLHAGPPLEWSRACPTVQAAILCSIRYEGWAPDDATARALIEGGRITLRPCHHAGAVGPMTGIVTASMPVFVVDNRAAGHRAHATVNVGLGKVLRFGAHDDSAVARLRWLADEAGPLLGQAIRRSGGIDLRAIMSQALRMGDEMHQRNIAASCLGDATQLRFQDNEFDAVLGLSVIHHIPNWKDCVDELLRITKPNGLLIIKELSIETFETPLGKLSRRLVEHPYDAMLKKKEFLDYLEQRGFKVISLLPHSMMYLLSDFFLVARKTSHGIGFNAHQGM